MDPDSLAFAYIDLAPDPHPELVAAQKVTFADLVEHGGLFPVQPVFRPAVPARPGGV